MLMCMTKENRNAMMSPYYKYNVSSLQDNHDSNRPRSDSSNDSAFDDIGSRLSNKSLDEDVANSKIPAGSRLDSTTRRYESKEARIERMVDAFRPIIEEIIKVTEVLPYLLFLGSALYSIF